MIVLINMEILTEQYAAGYRWKELTMNLVSNLDVKWWSVNFQDKHEFSVG